MTDENPQQVVTDNNTSLSILVWDDNNRASAKRLDIDNGVRCKHDRAYPRWAPHVNLFYPFLPKSQFLDIKARLQPLKEFEAFELHLDLVEEFVQGKNISVHFRPSDPSRINALFAEVRKLLPEVPMKHPDYHAHMTMGQSRAEDKELLMKDIRENFPNGIKMWVDEICLQSKLDQGEFTVSQSIYLKKPQ